MTSLNQSTSKAELAAGLDKALTRSGLSLSNLLARADELVLFGSRVTDLATADSDWDVLLVGDFEPIHREGIDLVVVSAKEIEADQWLGSELASHVSAYGVWLKGTGIWRAKTAISDEAVGSKQRRLRAQIQTFIELQRVQSVARRRQHAIGIRRQLQRLEMLSERKPVPTNPELDVKWNAMSNRARLDLVASCLQTWQLADVQASQLLIDAAESRKRSA
jgi:hypothetical protein